MSVYRTFGWLTFVLLAHGSATLVAAEENPASLRAELPPAIPWDGASQRLALPADSDHPWLTPAEREHLLATPSYDETVAWLRRLCNDSDRFSLRSIGKSGEGRDLWLVVASTSDSITPEALSRSGQPIVWVQAGIHSGEIDGKDAGLMLLRDLRADGRIGQLLEDVHLLFLPIFNVDGHERRTAFGRINQRGPAEMGWRTNSRNLNLNRDYAKADTPEMQALLRALGHWNPHLYVDLHVTDGIDYQYDITWGYGGEQSYSPAISRWLESRLDPALTRALEEEGHVPGYLVFGLDGQNPDQGLFKWSAASPRFSDGYGNARHLPSLLVENHSLKPYPQRVLGTYVFLAALLETLGREGPSLERAIASDRARRPKEIPLTFEVPADRAPEVIEFLGVEWERNPSRASGAEQLAWLGRPVTKQLPRIEPTEPGLTVRRPRAYWVPVAWPEVIERLALHGIEMEILEEATEVAVEMYRLEGASLAAEPFEGHGRVELEQPPTVERRTERYAAGSARVSMDQPLGDLAALLLEPQSPDSFLQWGFFLEILSRTEYVEAYVMAPLGDRMLKEDPELRARFEAALAADPELAENPRERLQWLYRETPYFDDRWRLYPVGREPVDPPPEPDPAKLGE